MEGGTTQDVAGGDDQSDDGGHRSDEGGRLPRPSALPGPGPEGRPQRRRGAGSVAVNTGRHQDFGSYRISRRPRKPPPARARPSTPRRCRGGLPRRLLRPRGGEPPGPAPGPRTGAPGLAGLGRVRRRLPLWPFVPAPRDLRAAGSSLLPPPRPSGLPRRPAQLFSPAAAPPAARAAPASLPPRLPPEPFPRPPPGRRSRAATSSPAAVPPPRLLPGRSALSPRWRPRVSSGHLRGPARGPGHPALSAPGK